MKYEQDEVQYLISKVKAHLITQEPFYATLLCNLPFVERNDIPTLAVDGKNVYYNKEYVKSLSFQNVIFAAAHEVMHCVFDHFARKGDRNPFKWNVAGDYVINDMLVTDKIGEIHPNWLLNRDIVQKGKNTEGVYNLIPDPPENSGFVIGAKGSPQDEVLPPEPGGQSQEEISQMWGIRAVQAAQSAKLAGKMPAGAERFIKSITEPKVDWKEVLRRFVSKRVKSDRSFARPNRRLITQGLYMPSFSGEALGNIAIAVDCSGSISEKVLNEFASEITYIKNTMKPSRIDVYYFDSRVSHEESYEPNDTLNIRPHGGGGTAFSPVIDRINSKSELPECCIFLTDLCCRDFGNPSDYPVLWVSNEDSKAPWGEVVMMDK